MDSDNLVPDPDTTQTFKDETQPTTLYVGNLDAQMTEEFLIVLFSQIGPVKGCKIIHETCGDLYAFVEFWERRVAESVLTTMNRRSCFGKELKVNWATSPNSLIKPNTSKHYHVFVGDLSSEIEAMTLRDAFAPFGVISDCRVVRDPQTCNSKGYGFVSFVRKSDAEAAIVGMNGQWLGNRSIRTNWARRKFRPPKIEVLASNSKELTFDEVYYQSSPVNCTVYCGGITHGLSEQLMQRTFSPFGRIQEMRVFEDKGYAFIRFATKESATQAIVTVNNTKINGQMVKCSWGKETGDPPNVSKQSKQVYTQQYGYGSVAEVRGQRPCGHQMDYWYQWYPQIGYPTTPPAAQMQGHIIQGMQGNLGDMQGITSWGQGMSGGADAAAAAARLGGTTKYGKKKKNGGLD